MAPIKRGFKPKRKIRSIGIKRVNKKATVRLVKQVMNRELETKYVTDMRTSIAFNSAIGNYNAEAYAAIPGVGLQNTVNQTYTRVGNEISPLSLTLDMIIGLNSVQRSCALKVDVYVMTRKDTKYIPTILARTDSPQFFNQGFSPGIQNYTGYPNNAYLRYNLNEFSILKHKSFILAGNVGLPNGDTTAGNSPNLLPGCAKQIHFNIPCPKTLKYSELTLTSATYPMNFAPFLVIGYSKVDGTGPDATFQSIVASWTCAMTFKDA